MRRVFPMVAVLAVLGVPAVSAAEVRIGLGADYWPRTYGQGFGHLTITVDGPLARHIQVGGRFGAMVTTSPNNFGVPLDLTIRAEIANRRVYLEGLVGPWLMFDDRSLIRLHGAFGFGLQSGALHFGIEVGWLDPSPHAGLRLAIQI